MPNNIRHNSELIQVTFHNRKSSLDATLVKLYSINPFYYRESHYLNYYSAYTLGYVLGDLIIHMPRCIGSNINCLGGYYLSYNSEKSNSGKVLENKKVF